MQPVSGIGRAMCAHGVKSQRVCKPGSVLRFGKPKRMCDHSSRRRIAAALMQPTRATGRRMPYAAPIRFCSRWGLPCRFCYQKRGALLPHRFDLAASKCGGLFSVALSLKLLSPDVIRHRSSLEPGLSSPEQLPAKRRSPNPLAKVR